MKKTITRFPPSPTGFFHIGSARTALFNYLFAKHHGGEMLLRFEDTDKQRSQKKYEDDIIEGLEWLGIPYTPAKPLRQSERLDAYRAYLKKLLDEELAYEAEEAEGGEGKVIRFKNPNKTVTFSDLIRGDVSFDTEELKDFVVARTIDAPLYHLTVVADDHDMGITHVLRGEDHISNTARQILILEALGFERPHYAHIPLILAPDRTKLSKRHGAVSVNEYKALGYSPKALINYLALLGWNPGGDQEIFTLEELAEKFSLDHVQKGGAIFDIEKLRWFNRQHMSNLSEDRFLEEVSRRIPTWDSAMVQKIVPLLRERINVWSDLEALKDELNFFFEEPGLDPAKIPGKGNAPEEAEEHLAELRKLLDALPSPEVSSEAVKTAVWSYAEAKGKGKVLWPLRYALTGHERSPDPFAVAAAIGREAILRRIDAARQALV